MGIAIFRLVGSAHANDKVKNELVCLSVCSRMLMLSSKSKANNGFRSKLKLQVQIQVCNNY